MCLAVPAKILTIDGNMAQVEIAGVIRKVGLELVTGVDIGDYVLIHAGYAVQVIDEEEALKTLELFKEIMEHEVS